MTTRAGAPIVVGIDGSQLGLKATETAAGEAALRNRDAHLLAVVGARGHGDLSGLLLGSMSHHLTRHESGPVLVAHPGLGQEPR